MTTSIVSFPDYFGKFLLAQHEDDARQITQQIKQNALIFLPKLNGLLQDFLDHGGTLPINPKTKNYLSGTQYGGWRPPDCPEGAPGSAHKEAKAGDIYDPQNELDDWLTTFDHAGGRNSKLEEHGLYREHPDFTDNWCHLTDRPPNSRNRTYRPV